MAKYVKTEQGYIDMPNFAPAPFKPEGKSYLTFSSSNRFTLAVYDATKHWNGILEYFSADKVWVVWDGTTTLSAVSDDGEYFLYLRGTGNKEITGFTNGQKYKWVLTGSEIACTGNIENLLDYGIVESGGHPTMASHCYNCIFEGCTALTQAPDLPATTLANSCYHSMFSGCTALTQAPALPATTLANYCYHSMFSGCTSLTKAPALPAKTLIDDCYNSMFYGCRSIKLSSTQTGEYTQEYIVGYTSNYAYLMFYRTGGTFTGTPDKDTYYLSTDNMIVRDTEVATLNGYVGSMIDNSVSNPLNITGATVGQIAKITAVDESGKPTSWEAVDDRLPKVSASDAGNVLGVEQIGEHEYGYALTHMPTLNDFIPLGITNASPGQFAKVSFVDDFGNPTAWEAADIYEKPNTGIPKTDLEQSVQTSLAKADTAISLGLTAAAPGQIIKVKTVQDGKPTEWEAVDMPSGDKWEKIKEITIAEGAEESNALTINADENGNTFRLKKARLCAKFPAYTGTSNIPNFSFAMINGKVTGRITPLLYTAVWPKISTKNITGTIYYVDVSGAQQIEHAQITGNSSWPDDTTRDYLVYGTIYDQLKTIYGDTLWAKPITSIGGTGMLIYPGCHFVLYGVRE